MISRMFYREDAPDWVQFRTEYGLWDVHDLDDPFDDLGEMYSSIMDDSYASMMEYIYSNNNHYPIIIYPESFIERMNQKFKIGHKKDDDYIYIEDFYEAANSYGKQKPGFTPLSYLEEPQQPICPKKKEIKSTYEVKKEKWRPGCYIPMWLILFGIQFWFYGSCFKWEWEALLPILVIAAFFTSMVLHNVPELKIGSWKTDYEEKNYTKEELSDLLKKEEENYQQKIKEYNQAREAYTQEHALYEKRKDYQTQFLNDPNNVKGIFLHLLRSFLKTSEPYETSDNPPQRGFAENSLFYELMKKMPSLVKVDTKLGPYFPDLTIDCGKVKIDIEIDEPYDYKTHKEAHYIGSIDESRNQYFSDCQWIVVRFTEKQAICNLDICVETIEGIVATLTKDYYTMFPYGGYYENFEENKWTKEEARVMAIDNYRNTYLTKNNPS